MVAKLTITDPPLCAFYACSMFKNIVLGMYKYLNTHSLNTTLINHLKNIHQYYNTITWGQLDLECSWCFTQDEHNNERFNWENDFPFFWDKYKDEFDKHNLHGIYIYLKADEDWTPDISYIVLKSFEKITPYLNKNNEDLNRTITILQVSVNNNVDIHQI